MYKKLCFSRFYGLWWYILSYFYYICNTKNPKSMKRLIFSLIIAVLTITTAVAAPSNKAKKIIKKEVANCKAKGWKPLSGAPSLEEQIASTLEHQTQYDSEGSPIYIIATYQGASMSPKMAESMAVQGCKTVAARELLAELGIYKAEKNINLGRPKRLAAMEREGKSGNIEITVTLAFNREEILKANSHLIKKN